MKQLDDYDRDILMVLAIIVIAILGLLALTADAQPRYTPMVSYVFDTSAVLNSGEELVCDDQSAVLLTSDGFSTGQALVIYDLYEPRSVPSQLDSVFFHVTSADYGARAYVLSYVINARTADTICAVLDLPNGSGKETYGFRFRTRGDKPARWYGLYMAEDSRGIINLDCSEYQGKKNASVRDTAKTDSLEVKESVSWVNEIGAVLFIGTERELRRSTKTGLFIYHKRLIYKLD